MESEPVRSHRGRRVAIVLGIVAVLALVGAPLALSAAIYEDNFGSRLQTAAFTERSPEEFPGLSERTSTFVSDKGQQLAGYLYTSADV